MIIISERLENVFYFLKLWLTRLFSRIKENFIDSKIEKEKQNSLLWDDFFFFTPVEPERVS